MAKYSDEFKISSVAKLELLNEKGTIKLDGVQIKNVRQLVAFLDVSSYSLYKWVNEIKYEGNMDEVEVEKEAIENRRVCILEGSCKAYQSDFDEGYGNCNMIGECNQFREKQILDGDENWFGQEKIDSTGDQKEIFGIRYYAWFARNLGVKNYSSMVLAQLKVAIGMKLIEQSGLIDMNKIAKKLSKNGDNL